MRCRGRCRRSSVDQATPCGRRSRRHGVAGSLSFRNASQYTTPAMMPPAIGPTIHTYQFAQSPVASAGPEPACRVHRGAGVRAERHDVERDHEADREPGRLGERAAIVHRGAEDREHEEERRRWPRSGCPCRRDAVAERRDAAVAGVEQLARAPGTSAGTRRRSRRASSATIRTTARWPTASCPSPTATIATAGFTRPPERCAVIETMIASTRPCASATPVRSSCPCRVQDRPRPAPMKISVNVATNSATAALPCALHGSLLAVDRGVAAEAGAVAEAVRTAAKTAQEGPGCVVACLPWTSCSSRPTPRRAS